MSALDELAARLPGALIALDFDGTLAPIVPDPTQSRPVPGAIDALVALAGRGSQIAIVTGRDAQTVIDLGDLQRIPSVIVSGLHGAETWHDGQLDTLAEPPGIQVLRDAVPAILAGTDQDVWLEDKRLSLVVHARRAADPERALRDVQAPVTRLAEQNGLEVHPGKQVLEIRIPQLSKATAVQQLLTEQTTAAFFSGDDLGDLPAFDAVRDWAEQSGRPGLTVGVGEVAQVRAATELHLHAPQELAELLRGLAGCHPQDQQHQQHQ
ncbi:MAG TPA: trehalose-phosphatase [Jatrophihabitans sp.]